MPTIKDLTGQRFGRLLVIEPEPVRNQGRVVWKCQCDCGNMTSIESSSLCRGYSHSCGCLQRELCGQTHSNKLEGKRFGRLVVIRPTEKREGHNIIWECMCDCGETAFVSTNSLSRGNTKSCGCLRRETSRKMRVTHGLSYTKEYKRVGWNRRRELKRLLDTAWTPEMDVALKIYFKACVVCGATEKLSIDHVRPLSKGNGLVPGNAVILCGTCNSRKFNKSLDKLPGVMRELIEDAAKRFDLYWNQKELLHPLDPLNYGWVSNKTIYEWRQFLKQELLIQRRYCSDLSGSPLGELGQMHEGIIPRSIIPKGIWWHFRLFHPYNSFLLTSAQHIPSPPSKEWAISKAYALYGRENVRRWFYGLPWKVRPFELP